MRVDGRAFIPADHMAQSLTTFYEHEILPSSPKGGKEKASIFEVFAAQIPGGE